MAEREGPLAAAAEASREPHAWDEALATTRRGFLAYMVAGSSTLLVGGAFLTADAEAEALGLPELADIVDLGDLLILAEAPYRYNLRLEVTADNRVRFELPRLEKGQGIATALAMVIADELDADYDRTDVELSDARADRPFTITGSSSTIRALYEPARTLAAAARARLITAAARRWNVDAGALTTSQSTVFAPDGRQASYGELSAEAAQVTHPDVPVELKQTSEFTLVGTPKGRKNARDIVTGRQAYTLDLDVPGAVPAVVARPPDIKGSVISYDDSVAAAMPGVIGIVQIPSGIAVAARTFQEAFDARDALVIEWAPGPLAGVSDADVRAQLRSIALPLTPALPLARSLTASFDFPYIAHAPLEVQAAIADVRADSAEIWFASQTPLFAAQEVAAATGIPQANVTLHVPPAGGSFGRRLFAEAPVEAALVSKALGVPIKLMWTRNDDMRHGRFRPMAHHDLRASWNFLGMLSYEHRVAAAETDFRHGLGDALTAAGFDVLALGVGPTAFQTTVTVPYRFGVASQLLVEQRFEVPTGSWRSIYSGFTMAANEMFVDELAKAQRIDPVAFRKRYLSSDAAKRCLTHVANAGSWGRSMPAGQAQGVAIHVEYRSAVAYLVEIDTNGEEPRLTRAFAAVDVGVPINPRGLEAQLQGALIDAFSAMFRAGNHLDDGRIREGSYGDFLWARMNHAPPKTEVHVFPAGDGEPGGAGELGFPPAAAACVNAYARATGSRPRSFPIGEYA